MFSKVNFDSVMLNLYNIYGLLPINTPILMYVIPEEIILYIL